MILLALELFAILVFAWAMVYAQAHRLDVRPLSHLQPFAIHHLYIGIGIYLLGFWFPWWVQLVGVVVTWDDAYQHAFQAFHHRVRFRSPLHRAYARVYIWYLTAYAWLLTWFDEHF